VAGDPPNVGKWKRTKSVTPQKVVEILTENFKNRTNVAAENKGIEHAQNVGATGWIVRVKRGNHRHLSTALDEHLRRIDDDLEGDEFTRFVVETLQYLTESTSAEKRMDFIAIGNVVAMDSPIVMRRSVKAEILRNRSRWANFDRRNADIINVWIAKDFRLLIRI
jgi:hypothetical protein